MKAYPYLPGVPSAGHLTAGGHWHPGRVDGCVKCPVEVVVRGRAVCKLCGLTTVDPPRRLTPRERRCNATVAGHRWEPEGRR